MTPDLDGLTLVQLLDRLEPVPEPPPVPMIPQTVGWVWLGIAVLAVVALWLRRMLRHRQASAYRRAALRALQAAGEDPAAIAAVLRRTALMAFPRSQIAGLTGANWLAFLDRTMSGNGFSQGPGQVLAQAPYRDCDPQPGLSNLAKDWIMRHRAPQPGAA
ncbi:DUF4381 domain-containing protein [Rhodobacteraceae bacterium F11138]|nr:DUF4381 domain-containing protein [Rhodobacteraceae bacterium F11138]